MVVRVGEQCGMNRCPGEQQRLQVPIVVCGKPGPPAIAPAHLCPPACQWLPVMLSGIFPPQLLLEKMSTVFCGGETTNSAMSGERHVCDVGS
jgi:hypothetical protein